MKTLAFWGRNNKNSARLIIIFSYVLLNLIALFLGDLFYSLNIAFTPIFCVFAVALTLIGYMIYPSKVRKHEYKNFFIRQKSADLLLVTSTFLFVVYFGNSLNTTNHSFRNPVQAISFITESNSSAFNHSSVEKKTLSKKDFRKKIRAELKSLRKAYKDSTKGQKTLYIALAVLAALVLGYGVAALACHISCSGSEALAIVVGIVGIAGIVFGLVKVIQRITRGKPMV